VRKWQLLQTVPAIRETNAAAILAETGGDITPFCDTVLDPFAARAEHQWNFGTAIRAVTP
jgi:hypothetical protein